MARDRKRAKQRRARQRAVVPPSQPRRANVPGELDHASGEVDQVEAAIVAGAGGEEAPLDEAAVDAPVDEAAVDTPVDATPADEPLDEVDFDEDFDEEEELDDDGALAGAGAGGPRRPTSVATRGERPVPEQRREGNAVMNFLRASWAELQRVQWPDRRQVAQATAVVLGFVALAGAYLGVADYVFGKLVDAII